jgi:hypothetical protein
MNTSISRSAQWHLLRYIHLVDMLRLFVSHPLENITVSRNSEFRVQASQVGTEARQIDWTWWLNLMTAKSPIWTHGLLVAASAEVMSIRIVRGQT